MNNLYDDIFVDVFGVEVATLRGSFSFQQVENWDSLAHLSLISEIEERFDIIVDPVDIIEFNSYDNGKVVLRKYGLEIE